MPRKTVLSYKTPLSIEKAALPKTNNFFNTRALVVLLVIASFFIGSLWTKVSYLEKNGSSQKTVAEEQAQPAKNQPAAPPANQKAKPVSDSDHIRGNKDAKISVIEYSDLECPFCKSFHPTTQELIKTYGDKIRLVYRHYPLSFHQNAQKEAEASECIAELGGNDTFWSFVDKIFERTTANGTGFALEKLGPLAQEIGVDQSKFQTCLDNGKYTKKVQDSITEGTSAGVNGTPSTFVVNAKGDSQMIVGAQPIEALKTIIDKYLTQK